MTEDIFSMISNSAEDTYDLGCEIGKWLERGQLILLSGDLGTGKTIMTQGICAGVGVEEDVTSPTFNLINEYESAFPIYHMDLYRLENEEELQDLGFEDYLDGKGIIIIEWPDIVYNIIPADFLYVKIRRISIEKREISIKAEGERSLRLIERVGKYVSNGY